MGLPSPAWYDDLLLVKLKTLIEAALLKPSAGRGPTCYEQFVRDLDTDDPSCRRAVEQMIAQTTARKPRRVTLRPIDHTLNESGDPGPETTSARARVRRRALAQRFGLGDIADSQEREEGSDRPWRFVPNRERVVVAGGEGESQAWRDYNVSMRNYWATDDDGVHTLDWFAYEEDRRDQADADAEAEAAANDEQVAGVAQRSPSMAFVLAQQDADRRAAAERQDNDDRRRELERARAAVSSDLPSLAEIWRAARESPLPPDVHTVAELTMALNASERSHAVYEATTLAQLVAELTSRDPAAGIRLRAMVRHRRSRENQMDATWLEARELSRASEAAAGVDIEPLWHSYVADLDTRGGQSRLVEHLPPNIRSEPGNSIGAFEAFARRHRALGRTAASASERSGGADSDRVGTPSALEADTPPSSIGLSPAPPAAVDCPTTGSPPPVASSSTLSPHATPFEPAAPPTSAELAERFARQRRSIAPMPSSARFAHTRTSSPNPTASSATSLGGTTEHYDSNRQRLRDILGSRPPSDLP